MSSISSDYTDYERITQMRNLLRVKEIYLIFFEICVIKRTARSL